MNRRFQVLDFRSRKLGRLLLSCGLLLGLAGLVRADAPAVKPVTVPFELLKTKHMTVMIKVNGKGPYRVIFDTGAPVTVLNNKIAKESGLIKDTKRPSLLNPFGSVGQMKVETLEVGGLAAKDVPVVVMDHPTVEAISKVLGPIEGIVGFPFFARYKMTLDYQAKEMTFVPNGFDPPDAMQALMASILAGGREKPPKQVIAPAGLWGMAVEKPSGDEEAGVVVKEVHPGGAAAAAGLKAGDRLLALDGRWADTVEECYRAAATVKAGTATKVAVKRGGKEMELTVTPAAGL